MFQKKSRVYLIVYKKEFNVNILISKIFYTINQSYTILTICQYMTG